MKSSATLSSKDRRCMQHAPDGGDEGQAGECVPLLGEIVIDQFFAGSLETIGALFQSQQSWIADDDRGVGSIEHGVEIGGHREERHVRVAPFVKEDAGVSQGGAAGGIRGNAAQISERPAGAPHQQQRAHASL